MSTGKSRLVAAHTCISLLPVVYCMAMTRHTGGVSPSVDKTWRCCNVTATLLSMASRAAAWLPSDASPKTLFGTATSTSEPTGSGGVLAPYPSTCSIRRVQRKLSSFSSHPLTRAETIAVPGAGAGDCAAFSIDSSPLSSCLLEEQAVDRSTKDRSRVR